MHPSIQKIETIAQRIAALASNTEKCISVLSEAFEEYFPGCAVSIFFEKSPGDHSIILEDYSKPATFQIPVHDGFFGIEFHDPDLEHQTSPILFVFYVATVISLRNEQAVGNRLSVLLNNEIDKHHMTDRSLHSERAARVGFEKELEAYSRKITEAIVETQEMERRRFARDLHDGIGNTLSMVKLLISSLQQDYNGGEEDDGTFSRLFMLLDNAVVESRQLSRSLTSEMLIEHGLIPTLKEMISRINASGSIRADFQVFGISQPLPKHMEQNLFRIIQELVNNILKHARASEFTVQCIQHENAIIVMVEDDGIGIESEDPGNMMKGMGFGNIRTRLNVLNGTIAIDSSPGRGTIITLEVPFPGIVGAIET